MRNGDPTALLMIGSNESIAYLIYLLSLCAALEQIFLLSELVKLLIKKKV